MKSTCKILMIMNEDPMKPSGGLGVHVQKLADELRQDKNIELTILAVDYCSQRGGLFQVSEDETEVSPDEFKPKSKHYRLLKSFPTNDLCNQYGFITRVITDDTFLESALKFLGREEFDIIHIHDSNLWKVAKNLKVLFNAKIVLTCHLSFYIAHPSAPENPYYMYDAQLEGTALHMCDKLITVSEAYKNAVSDVYFLDKEISVIPNGVSYDFLKGIKYDEELREKYGKKLVVFVGRLVPTKGVTNILDTIERMPNHHFVLIADLAPTLENVSPLVKRMKKMKKQGINNFEWLNYLEQDEKWKLMKIADIGIVPSLHEPFGIVALEWLALGVPLIASNTGGLKEFCNDDNATMIEPTELKEAIREHKPYLDKIAKGIETAKKYNWPMVAKQTKDVYLTLLK